MTVDKTLNERGQNYGSFDQHAIISQGMKRIAHMGRGWATARPDEREAIDMILHKIARLVNGNPHHMDSWHDIQGYAKLVEDRLKEEQADLFDAGVPVSDGN